MVNFCLGCGATNNLTEVMIFLVSQAKLTKRLWLNLQKNSEVCYLYSRRSLDKIGHDHGHGKRRNQSHANAIGAPGGPVCRP